MADDHAALLDAIQSIRVWKQGDQRAPNKPLLLLYALGRVQRGEPRLVPFPDVEVAVNRLLRNFGRDSKAEYPFWHLTSDGLWEIPGGDALVLTKGDKRPLLKELRTVSGGFPAAFQAKLAASPGLLRQVARTILDEHFPASYHDELTNAVGLDLDESTVISERKRHDPSFAPLVLRAYGFRCAVCGLDPSLDGSSIGLEAAHVHWHCHGGPDVIANGLSLCSLHHTAFDKGLLGLAEDNRVVVSGRLHGGEVVENYIGQYHGQVLKGPVHGAEPVGSRFRAWHEHNVFKVPARAA
jgi:putative restriction endonuclease